MILHSITLVHDSKVKQMICKGPFDYARNVWEIAFKGSMRVAIYNDVLAKFDDMWGGNGLLYHRLDS